MKDADTDPPLTRAAQRERSRARILKAAHTLLSRDDADFTARGVAERAGVSAGLVLQHFATMADLALEVFLELNAGVAQMLADAEDEGETPQDKALAAIRTLLERDMSRRALTGRVMAFAWTWTPEHEERLQASVAVLREGLARILVEQGLAAPEDASAGAGALWTIYNGYLRLGVAHGLTAQDTFARMRPALELTLAGLAARAGR